MAVVLAIGAAMVIATSNAALALPPKKDTERQPLNGGIDLLITTECENPSGTNGPQSDNCPNEKFEKVTACEPTNNGGGTPKGHEKDCPPIEE